VAHSRYVGRPCRPVYARADSEGRPERPGPEGRVGGTKTPRDEAEAFPEQPDDGSRYPRGDYDRNIFVNCPFDSQYKRLFHALVFTIHECGFWARCALEVEDSGEERIRKIKRIIRECRYGIHDISRVELDAVHQLPRFNMPLELGLFLGAQEYGDQEQARKCSLVLDTEHYRYQKFCSDIAGQDIRAHDGQPARLIAAVRSMLSTALDGRARIPGPAAIQKRYTEFRAYLPVIGRQMHVRLSELQFVEYQVFVEEWLAQNPLRSDRQAGR
jgi:hypothetical protein